MGKVSTKTYDEYLRKKADDEAAFLGILRDFKKCEVSDLIIHAP